MMIALYHKHKGTSELFINILAIMLPALIMAEKIPSRAFISSGLTLENQSFDITSVNFPQSNSYTMSLLQDSAYNATMDPTDSTITPSSLIASSNIRPYFALGYDFNYISMLTVRSKIFTSLGNSQTLNVQYIMYAPFLEASPLVTTSGVTLTNVLANSTEMINITQGPTIGITLAPLVRFSDRFSLGPSYTVTRTNWQSSEYLYNVNNSPNLPYYTGSVSIQSNIFGAISTYKLNHKTSMTLSLESNIQKQLAQKEIYFNTDSDGIVSRNLPSSTTVTTSNWNGISCNNQNTCTCQAGADCSLNASQAYSVAAHLNLDRVLTRISLGFDFMLGEPN